MKPPTLNKDGTPRKKHRKGAGRPATGRKVPITMRHKPETVDAIKRLARRWKCSQAAVVERAVMECQTRLKDASRS